MSVRIVVESMFGNTREVAEQIADGLREAAPGADVVVVSTSQPAQLPAGVSLLLLGGPTHAFGMSRMETRADAERAGARGDAHRGVREWIAEAQPFDGRVVTFDTRIKHFPGSAARAAANELAARGFPRVEQGESFWVRGKSGPLRTGEAERARGWGQALADSEGGGPR